MSIEGTIKGLLGVAQFDEDNGLYDSACEKRQIASWLQELKERREKESRGINLAKPYLTIQVDTEMMHRVVDETINNMYFECKNCGQKMFPHRKEESK